MFLTYPLRDEPPCWYELVWNQKVASPAFRIRHEALAQSADLPNARIVRALSEKFGFERFESDADSPVFGFNSSCSRIAGADGFAEIGINLPYLREDKKCDMCGGTGRDKEYGGECNFCSGTGKSYRIDHGRIFPIAATAQVLTTLLAEPVKAECAVKQIMTVKTSFDTGLHGGSLGAGISKALAEWIRSEPEDVARLAAQAMHMAYRKMMGEDGRSRMGEFRSVAHPNGHIHLSCPGNACGLDPELYSSEDRGYELAPHNVDTPWQQFTLLAGLAAIHSEARRQNV